MKITYQKDQEAEATGELFVLGVCLGFEPAEKDGTFRLVLTPPQWRLLSQTAKRLAEEGGA